MLNDVIYCDALNDPWNCENITMCVEDMFTYMSHATVDFQDLLKNLLDIKKHPKLKNIGVGSHPPNDSNFNSFLDHVSLYCIY